MLSLHDRLALITGGGSGIGEAVARLFASHRARVAVCGRRRAPLDAVVAAIEHDGGVARAFEADVSDPSAAGALIDSVVGWGGGLDILVNNAAHYRPSSVDQESAESWDLHFATNARGPFLLCQGAHDALRDSPAGVVVNVLSTLAARPVSGVAAYSASKAALLSLTQTLALEWAADGIRVVAVSPGVVDTPIHDPERLAEMGPAHPLGRVGRPEDVARAVLFLATEASAWTTGSVLSVDGGIHLA